jgi:hypothetical protein
VKLGGDSCPLRAVPASQRNGEPRRCVRRFSGCIAGLSQQGPAAQPVGAAEHCTVKKDGPRSENEDQKRGFEDTVRISWEGED